MASSYLDDIITMVIFGFIAFVIPGARYGIYIMPAFRTLKNKNEYQV